MTKRPTTKRAPARKRAPSRRVARKPEPYAELVTVTPKMAQEWLQNGAVNRRASRTHIASMQRAMDRGEWLPTGDTIKFDPDGQRIDGEQRLRAIVAAGTAVKIFIAYNIPPESIRVVDTGRKRTMGSQLTILKEPNANLLAATLLWLWNYREVKLLTPDTANHLELFDLLERNPGVRDAVAQTSCNRPPTGLSQMTTLVYCGNFVDQDAVASFIDDVATGVSVKRTSPAYLLRERMLAHKTSKRKMGRNEVLALTIKAFNAYARGEDIRILKWTRFGRTSEDFPEIDGFDRAVI